MYASLIDLLQARADGIPDRTAFIFLADGETETDRLTFAELDRRARAIGQGLRERGFGGERILLLYPPGLDFVAAFFGCLYAGSVAVTGYPPSQNRHIGRLRAIVVDACPAAALTSAETLPSLREAAAAIPEMSGVACLSTSGGEGDPGIWRSPGIGPEDLAFLQYTSGSTATPKGVMVGHGNLLHNCGLLADRWGLSPASVMVSWLPTFHDLGLIYGMLSPVWAGFPAVHMPPAAFLKQPVRWLRAISRYRGTHSGGPNFGFELCVRRVSPEQRADLDLSSWELALNGAEPIRLSTLQGFYESFREQGLRWTVSRPGYGLAEGTLLVSGSAIGEEPRWLMLDDAALQKDRVVLSSGPGSRPLIGCGRPVADWEVLIVHPETLKPCGPDEVGEVWVAGPSVAHGYWQRPEETERTFGGRLATGEGPYLRTGDLGFLHEEELYITGRLKDLIIIRGSNHYPQDIEATAERAYPGLRPGSTAAFALDEDGEERLVVVGELERPEEHDIPEVIRTVRQAVAEEHELQVHGVVLAKKGAVPKTSSGKIQRRGCRAALQDGTLPVVARSFEPVVSEKAPQASAAESAGGAEVRAWLLGRVAERLGVPPESLDVREPLARYGLDSAAAVELAGQVEEWLERPQPQTLFYDHPTIEALARHLAGEEARRSGGEPAAARPGEPVAIVGIGCRFPGAAGAEAFWRLLATGVDAVAERAPGARSPGPGRPGGFLEGVDLFDAAFFGISPREATHMDPQQRLLLEVAWEALEDAGRDPRALAGTRTGVFIGISSADYGYLQFASPERAEAASGPGGALSVAANRLSYFFDWHGPSLAVDTACSASLVAVDLACRALAAGECSLALAGGVNVALMEGTTRAFERAGLIAGGGRCRAFDQAADGYVRSEGAGVVVLKPLSRAQEDGDPIYAVIRGTAVNQDGRTNGLVAPSRQAQEEVLREAWRRAGVPPGRARYVEAHGSGTALGDAIEAAALGSVLAEGRAPDAPCLVGSVKTNLGHLESAAGIAGLIKTALSLAHRQVPPSLHFRQPSARIPFAALPLRVNTGLRPLPAGDGPALAGVSSFGMGGTNAHVVLEEAPPAPARPAAPGRPWQVLVWSARSESALEEATERLARHLAEHPEEDLADLAFTLQTGRSVFPWRRALVCRSREDAAAALASRDPRRLLTQQRRDEPRPLAFVFPGLADHYPGMGRDLYRAEPVFRAELDRCCEILLPLLGLDPRESLLAPEAAGEERPAAGGPLRAWLRPQGETVRGALRRTAVAQPVLFAVELALARLLQSWGLAPQALLGFSLGEYTAACLAGVFSPEDALRVVARRAALIEELPAGAMLAVPLPAAEARKWLGAELSLAVDAGARYSVVAGPEAAVAELEERLAAEGHVCRRLPNAHAFHSAQMRAAAEPFAALLREVRLAPPRLPWVSNVTGTWITAEQATDPQYWVTHMCETVRFADGVGELWREPAMVLLEVGPGQGLSTLARQLAEDPPGRLALPSMRHAHDTTPDLEHLLGAVARLWLAGVAVDWRSFHGGSRRTLRLPSYPFERQSFWLEPAGEPAPAPSAQALVRLVFRRPGDDGSGEADGAAVPAELVATLRRLLADRGLDRLVITAEDLAAEEPMEAAPAAERQRPLRYRRPDLATPFVPPAGETERTIAGLVGALLGIEEVGAHDNFFELGGDSILAIQLTYRAAEAGLELTPRQLFAHPTVAGLAAVAKVLAGAPASGGGAAGPVSPDRYPTTPLQQGMLFHTLEASGSGVYVIQLSLALGGGLDAEAFESAWKRVVQRHPVLRTSFAWRGVEAPLQVVHPEVEPVWDRRDWCGLPAAEQQRRWEAFLAEDRRRGFDVSAAPLMRLALISLEDGGFRFLWTYHQALLDGWSLTLLLRELFAVYTAVVDGREAELEPVVPFERYLAWRMEQDAAEAEPFWRDALQGFRVPTPLSEEAAGGGAAGHGQVVAQLPPEGTEALRRFARSHHLTLNSLVQGAWALLLGRYSGTGDVLFGAVTSGRSAPVRDIEKMVGLFINTLPVRTGVAPRSELTAWLRAVQERQAAATRFEHVSLTQIQGWSEVPRGRALFESLLVFENIPIDDALRRQTGVWLGIGEAEVLEQTNYPLTLIAVPGGSLVLKLLFDRRHFAASTVVRMLGHLESLLAVLPASAGRVLEDLPLLAGAERHALLTEWNDTRRPAAEPALVHQAFAEQARRSPDATALVFRDEVWSYSCLADRAHRLARRLRRMGVGPEVRVGVHLERSPAMLLALLGTFEAGGAYVPLDPTYPRERLAFMAGDAGIEILLTERRFASMLPGTGLTPLFLDAEQEEDAAAAPQPAPPAACDPESLAYLIYTSGSTGRPKGVQIPHRALTSFLSSMRERPGLCPGDRLLAVTTLSFDIAGLELFLPLVAGACVVIAERDEAVDGHRLAARLATSGATVMQATPATWRLLLDAGWQGRPGLRALCGGEALPRPLADQLLAMGSPLWNLYGPTETTIWSTVERVAHEEGAVSLGRPIANTAVHILDGAFLSAPLGRPGELCIGGRGVARGYWNRPDLTAERFIPAPFSPEPGARLYRTGDLVRWSAAGRLEFLGRIDHQLKVRGFRIELGEIEGVLLRHPGVAQAVATAWESSSGDRRLVAYLVPRGEERPGVEALRGFLAEHLPAYMIPAAFVLLDAFPLTPNGKVDRRALPPPEWVATSAYVAPQTPVEEKLTELWRELLQVERVGIHDDFFELGGHSLLAMQLASRLGEAFGTMLTSSVVLDHPTPHLLARLLASPGALAPAGPVQGPPGMPPPPPLVAVPRSAGLPLTIAQQRMWLLEQLRPGGVSSTAAALRIRGPLDPAALIRGFQAVVRRHESLRTNFAAGDRGPVQVIHPEPTTGLAEVDLSALPPAARKPEALRFAMDDAVRSFDLVREPLIRARLFRLAPSEWVLSLSLHHIVSDLWSMTVVFLPELGALYQAFLEGRPSALPPLSLQGADVAVWEQSWLRGEVLAEHLRYWRERLVEAPELLPRLADAPEGEASRNGRLELALPPALVERLAAVGAGEGVTRFMIFLAAFDIVLARAASIERVAVVTNIAGRNHPETQRLIGGFARRIALVTDLSGDPTLREVLRRARGTVLEAHAYQALSLQDIIERLAGDARLGHLADIELTVDPPGSAALGLPRMQMDLLPQMVDQSESGLSLQIASGAGALWAVFGYDASRFQADTITRFAEQLQTVMRALAETPDRRLGDLLGELAAADAGAWSSRETELVEASLGRLRQLRRRKPS